MRAVIQRVKQAWVQVDGQEVAGIGHGLLVFIGIGEKDNEQAIAYIVDKTINLRIFEDQAGKMNLSVLDVEGEILLVSQFTLYGDVRRGRRPSFSHAMAPQQARMMFDRVEQAFRNAYPRCKTGQFQAMMDVGLVNDGPVTILLDSDKTF